MDENDLDKNGKFLVKDSKLINYLFSSIFFAMFLGIVITLNSTYDYKKEIYQFIIFSTLVPAILLFIKAIKQRIIFEISAQGILHNGNFITNWENFINAYITQEEIPGSVSDNFRLMVAYYAPEKGTNYMVKINIESTQNKSEEQIISAINYFLLKNRNH